MMSRLESQLPEWLYYHSPGHTRYVIKKSIFLAAQEGIAEEDLELLKLAALYHDSGFLLGPENHEEAGCELASDDLMAYGLERDKVDQICRMIMATRIPQRPESLLEKLLADADLEYLGTSNFYTFGNDLYREIQHFNPKMSQEEWDKLQVDFLMAHTYHTDYCKKHLEPVKLEHLAQLKEKLAAS